MKEFLEIRDSSSEMKAYDYCKAKKRSDLAVVLEEFVDTTKSVIEIEFSYIEGFDFKGQAPLIYAKEIETIKRMDCKNQYLPIHEAFLK